MQSLSHFLCYCMTSRLDAYVVVAVRGAPVLVVFAQAVRSL